MKGRFGIGRASFAAALLLIAALVVAGCGSGGSDSTSAGGSETTSVGQTSSGGGGEAAGSGMEAAEKLVAEASAKHDKWNGPTSSPPPAKGVTVGILPCSKALPGCQRIAEGAEEAAKVLGWKSITIDGRAEAQAEAQAMNSFIARGVDAIFLAAAAPQEFSEQVETAISKGIPVVGGFTPTVTEFGGFAAVAQQDERVGEIVGAYVISEGCGGIISFTSEENPQIKERSDGITKFLEENGEGNCDQLENESIPLAQTGAPEESIISSLLQKNAGKVNWFTAGFDAQLRPMVQSAEAAGQTDIKGVSSDGDLESIELIREEKGQVATVSTPLQWVGWGGMDQVNRALNEEEPAPDEGLEEKLITKDDLPPQGEAYDGDLDYRAEFEKIWNAG